MALQLKSTGLATSLVACVVVDGDTVVDLCGNTIDVHENVAQDVTTWKGVAQKYFITSGSGYTAYGVSWAGTRPAADTAIGLAIFMAAAGIGAGGGNSTRSLVSYDDSNSIGLSRNNTSGLARFGTSNYAATGATEIPTNGTTKFSLGGNYKQNSTGEMFYGLESGSLASDSGGPQSIGNEGFATLYGIGGRSGTAYSSVKPFIVAAFNRELTLAEFQSLHNDWYGTLFVSGAATIALAPDPASVVVGGTTQITITRDTPAPAGAGATFNLLSETPASATVPATVNMAEGQTTATFNVTGVSAGSSTITATNAADSNETDSITVNVVTVRKLKLLAHIDALGATAVKGAVFEAPAGGALLGAPIGEFSGAAFGASSENGQAPLEVAVADFGGSALTTADTPVCVWEGTSSATSTLGNAAPIGSNGVHECTVIEV